LHVVVLNERHAQKLRVLVDAFAPNANAEVGPKALKEPFDRRNSFELLRLEAELQHHTESHGVQRLDARVARHEQ
jgi:hypothetical protein